MGDQAWVLGICFQCILVGTRSVQMSSGQDVVGGMSSDSGWGWSGKSSESGLGKSSESGLMVVGGSPVRVV